MIDFLKYAKFVNAVTSVQSKEHEAFIYRLKKIVFQGKPVNEDNLFHLKREMGDIMWYFMQACMALDVSPEEIIEMNVDKLKSRYPGGEFDVHYSENRKEGDV
jgi:NTP pyrophosphatase (non-canonical NTP hydrolase)